MLSKEDVAGLVPCSLKDVERMAGLGLLSPAEDGSLPSSDVHVVRLMFAFEESGIDLEARCAAGSS